MGRRSGIYARKLVKKGGFEKEKVRKESGGKEAKRGL